MEYTHGNFGLAYGIGMVEPGAPGDFICPCGEVVRLFKDKSPLCSCGRFYLYEDGDKPCILVNEDGMLGRTP